MSTAKRQVARRSWTTGLALLFDPTESYDIDDVVRGRIRARQVGSIISLTRTLMIAKIVNASVLAYVLWQTGYFDLVVALWLSVALLLSISSMVKIWLLKDRPLPEQLPRRTIRKVILNAAFSGIVWGLPGLWFLSYVDGLAQAFLVAIAAGTIAGGALVFYTIPTAAIAYIAAISMLGLIGYAIKGDPGLEAYCIIMAVYVFSIFCAVRVHSRIFVDEFIGRTELDRKNVQISNLLEEIQAQANEERRRNEARLAHAQKMEAIGQLTGGLAHDFNNLLAAIQGNAELLHLEGKGDRALLTPILNSTARGSDLVHRLLTFSRKQFLKPQTLCLSTLIGGMISLLHRTLGAHIQINTRFDDDLWHIRVDPAQMESAVLNLCLNARDAVGNGGRLDIHCRNVSAATSLKLRKQGVTEGDFVEIMVTDNGRGMEQVVADRAVEPFFTTKGRGQSSGMGLSTVYGFTRQSQGHLTIDSVVGSGTTIRIFLPKDEASPQREICGPVAQSRGGRTEQVLVVEDDAAVRRLVHDLLLSLGYSVTDVPNASVALDLIRDGALPDLVICDVNLPGGLSGPELARELEDSGCVASILMMSGMPIDARDGSVSIAESCPILAKPFDRNALATMVRHALDAPTKIPLSKISAASVA